MKDIRLLAMLAIITILVSGFLALADAVGSLRTAELDRLLLLALRSGPDDPIGPAWLEDAIINLSALGSGAVAGLIVAFAAAFLILDRRPYHAALLVVCALGTWLAMELLKELYGRDRPTLVVPLDPAGGGSFPSGHTMIATALYLTLGELIARGLARRTLQVFVIATAVIVSLIVGLSRIYIGVHYPSDVVGGWAVGATWALLLGIVARRLQRRGVVEAAGEHAIG